MSPMAEEKTRAYCLDDAGGLDRAHEDLVTETGNGYAVQIPSEGHRVVVVTSREDATVIAEAEVLRQMLAA